MLKTIFLYLSYFLSLVFRPFIKKSKVYVLMYHSVSNNTWKHSVSLFEFERQIQYIIRHFDIISLEQAYQFIKQDVPINRKSVVLTFDDVYKDTIELVVPILKKYNISATFFLTTDLEKKEVLGNLERPKISDLTEIVKLKTISIECHGHSHARLVQLTDDQIQKDINLSRDFMKDLTGDYPLFFAYPFGYTDARVQGIVSKYFKAACGISEGILASNDNVYNVKRIQVDKTISFKQFKLRLTPALLVNRFVVDFARNFYCSIKKIKDAILISMNKIIKHSESLILKLKKHLGHVKIFGILFNAIRWFYFLPVFRGVRFRMVIVPEIGFIYKKVFNKTLSNDLVNEFLKSKAFNLVFDKYQSRDFVTALLYIVIRECRPSVCIETGISSGRSSTAILEALEKNNHGILYSIDLPKLTDSDTTEVVKVGDNSYRQYIPKNVSEPGWLVPKTLQQRWNKILGDSLQELPKLVNQLGEIDLFFHDSDHTYSSMTFEFDTVWPHIRNGGLLFSDDIVENTAFFDFSLKSKVTFKHEYNGLGIIKKANG